LYNKVLITPLEDGWVKIEGTKLVVGSIRRRII